MILPWLALWSHVLAAVLFGGTALWRIRRGGGTARGRWLIAAFAATALWSLSAAALGSHAVITGLAENGRNLTWLGFMFLLLRQGGRQDQRFAVSMLYGVLFLISIGLITAGMAQLVFITPGYAPGQIALAALTLRMMIAVGALVLVHNLYTAAVPGARSSIRLLMIVLAMMWIYDLNLFTVAYLSRDWPEELVAGRALVMALLAPVFTLATWKNESWQMRLSRSVAFRSLSLVGIGAYLLAMGLITSAIQSIGGDHTRMIQVSFVFAASIAAFVLLTPQRARAWFNVIISKHFFAHRFDYRTEWIRFTETLGRPTEGDAPLAERIVKAVADITESPGGLLLIPDEGRALTAHAYWNWSAADTPLLGGHDALTRHLEQSGRIIEFDALRVIGDENDGEAALIPEWVLAEPRAWALVPLVHFDRLQGAVLLERPRIDRKLDWEDFDLLRVAGRQVASYLAEARGQEALSDARRFDEFNRRFAFIMHDIKNLVSQLSLVTRNAERHADNPEFRADMIATLRSSTAKMNDLLARLSQHNTVRIEEPRALSAARVVESAAAARKAQHPIVTMVSGDPMLLADPSRLEQALGHLVQNAIEASPPDEPIVINVIDHGHEIAIVVRDKGAGMEQDFIRNGLFRPFASTKSNGFGVGAFEARALISAMGGRIEVESRPGAGSIFTLILPAAAILPVGNIPVLETQ